MKLGVVGLGAMGSGIAQLAIEAGLETVGREVELGRAEAARDRVAHFLTRKVEKGQLYQAARDEAVARLHLTTDLADLADCDVVIEAAFEDLGVKHELFRELRSKCPVHWTSHISDWPDEEGYWSVTRAEDIHTVSRDWRTYSSELGGVTATTNVFPLELSRAMFIGMDPPKHDRLKMLFQAGFTPKRIAAHEQRIRKIVSDVLDRLDGQTHADLVNAELLSFITA